MCAAVGVTELFAQFCANQLVRRAIAGAVEKYFQGVCGPWIIFAWSVADNAHYPHALHRTLAPRKKNA